MRWSTKAPKKAGWYLVTLKDGIVMPAYRSEYPTGNFTWKELPHGSVVIASIRFPKAYKEETQESYPISFSKVPGRPPANATQGARRNRV